MLLFPTKKTEFPFFEFPYSRVLPAWPQQYALRATKCDVNSGVLMWTGRTSKSRQILKPQKEIKNVNISGSERGQPKWMLFQWLIWLLTLIANHSHLQHICECDVCSVANLITETDVHAAHHAMDKNHQQKHHCECRPPVTLLHIWYWHSCCVKPFHTKACCDGTQVGPA